MKEVKKDTDEVILHSDITHEKFFPNADNWMWNYCFYLGSSTDPSLEVEDKYDVGYWLNLKARNLSFANVVGDCSGEYHSGAILMDGKFQPELIEGIIKDPWKMYLDAYKLILKANPFNLQDIIIREVSENPNNFSQGFKDYHNEVFNEIRINVF